MSRGSNNIKNSIVVKGLDGQAYIVNLENLQKIQLEATKPTEFVEATITNTTDFFEYGGFMAFEDNKPRATIN